MNIKQENGTRWTVNLQKDPNNPKSPFTYNIERQCPIILDSVLSFLDKSYGKIIEIVEIKSQPSWKAIKQKRFWFSWPIHYN